ncbi:ASCH domain-containing protein [Conservatibacter flavescens]|uniref:ASCH domain-containing protein n=1 Tax=Conservatibacter flavescens TaxID=28161 RepID=A0A2M8S2N1_9PAST|nr:ASCH domain-containing protein [Conservatibacter flavescens]PJG85395.1 hypothetical protein CVP05_06625 [Conservatibacter flavescens]
MKILMSIKPEYVEKIFSGEKKYELRRKIFIHRVKSIIIYSTYPVMKVVGEFEVKNIKIDSPSNIFNTYHNVICIDKEKFFKYFSNATKAYAIEIGQVFKYEEPKTLMSLGIKKAPQSYMYIR